MCLVVYVAGDAPLEIDGPPARDGAMALAPVGRVPAALRDRAHVAMLVDWHGGRRGCSCRFHEASLPWEPREEAPETLEAFARLRFEVEAQVAAGGRPLVFAAWDGHEDEPARLVWRMAPGQIAPGPGLFQGGDRMEGGVPPDTYLLEFEPGLAEPVARVAGQ